MSREFDLVLYGATGATGRQAAKYLDGCKPDGLRWAVAGRNQSRLDALGLKVPALVADSQDARQIDELVARTRLVLNMAGPFRRYGDPVVDGCIRQGTHYCDISGETARIRDLIDRYHRQAAEQRLRIVPFCGASSVPADMAVHLLLAKLGVGRSTIKAALRLQGGSFGSGTIASIGEAVTSGDAKRETNPFLLGPNNRSPEPVERDPRGIRYDRDMDAWTVFSPLGLSDTRAVRWSAVLARRDTVFQEYLAFDDAARAATTWAALGGFRAALRWRPTRALLGRLSHLSEKPGGSSHRASYDLRVIGTSADGQRLGVRVHGIGDPGNRITVLCACECALTLVSNDAALPDEFGVLTPSIGIGEALVVWLRAAGLNIDIDALNDALPRAVA